MDELSSVTSGAARALNGLPGHGGKPSCKAQLFLSSPALSEKAFLSCPKLLGSNSHHPSASQGAEGVWLKSLDPKGPLSRNPVTVPIVKQVNLNNIFVLATDSGHFRGV